MRGGRNRNKSKREHERLMRTSPIWYLLNEVAWVQSFATGTDERCCAMSDYERLMEIKKRTATAFYSVQRMENWHIEAQNASMFKNGDEALASFMETDEYCSLGWFIRWLVKPILAKFARYMFNVGVAA